MPSGEQPTTAVLFFGSRDFAYETIIRETMRKVVERFGRDVEVVHGGCGWDPKRRVLESADALAAAAAVSIGIRQAAVFAEWLQYGREAGPRRNKQLLNTHHPVLGLGFCSQRFLTPGTADMLRRLTRAKLPRAIWYAGKGWDRDPDLEIEKAWLVRLSA